MSAPSSCIEAAAADESGLRSASSTVPQDWDALRRYLASQGLALADTEPRQFSGGLGNLNYRIALDGRACVLRRPPAGVLPTGANNMAREYRILRGLAPRFALAPAALHFCDDTRVLGAPFLIMEYRPGLVIGSKLPEHVDAADCARMAATMVDILVRLHEIDPEEADLGTLGRPQGQFGRTIEAWYTRAHAAYGENTPGSVARICGQLRAALPAAGQPRLLHNDFKLDNIILEPLTLEPRAVIDWDMGTRGDPLVDLATLLSYWTEAGDPPAMHRLNQMPTARTGFPSRADVVQAYALRTGRDVSRFQFHRILALFRLSVVFMQLHARFLRGEVDDERYRGFGELASDLLAFTEQEQACNPFN